jgi:hypothetical protein
MKDVIELSHYSKIIDNMEQIRSDVDFIDSFYSVLSDLFNRVEELGGVTICNSYAVFHKDTQPFIYRNYYMFPKIKELFANRYPKRVLSEWVFTFDNSCTFMFFPSITSKPIRITYSEHMKNLGPINTLNVVDIHDSLRICVVGYNPSYLVAETVYVSGNTIYDDIKLTKIMAPKQPGIKKYMNVIFLDEISLS